MRGLPINLGIVHFVGIGGIGMSGIAEVLHNLGYRVQGSDLAEGANVQRLRGLGIEIAIGHRPENLGEAEVVVISSAVKPGNPELEAARAEFLPVVRRAEMLAELMRLKFSIAIGGTHGKTTTTSMVASLLETADLDPTVINGGIINAYGTNTRLGEGDWMVVEADESDGTFTKLPALVSVVTNMDPEHLDFYGDAETMQEAYKTFVQNIPFYGFAVLCIDHPVVQSMIGRIEDRRMVTYGLSAAAEVRGIDLEPLPDGFRFSVEITPRHGGERQVWRDMILPMLGQHNVQNALSVIAIAHELEMGEEIARKALTRFEGVKRRFTRTGQVAGVTVIDDYGHHPVEIAAVLSAARQHLLGQVEGGRVIAVVQPHRYTRLSDLFEEFCACFNDADRVLVADVHAAGEAPLPGIDGMALAAGLRSHGHPAADYLPDPAGLAQVIHKVARPGDLVVCLGAGSITQWANALPAELAELYGEAVT
ncbi:MAG: UDP-N-acetylmuramate--L-alanine ligase [Rhodospirillales bacterium]